MKLSTCSLLLAAGLAFTACDSLPTSGLNPLAPGGGGGGANMLKDSPAMYIFQPVPKNAEVGMFWEVESSGSTTRTAIVAEQDGKFIFEQTGMHGEDMVAAFLVDPTVDMMATVAVGEPMTSNVSAAWYGKVGEKPNKRDVMEPGEMPEMPDVEVPEVESTSGTQTVNMAGRDFNTEWMASGDSKVWTDQASGLMVRMDYGGDTMTKLTGYGMDAKPALDWTE